jgi:glucose/arabinose dehydrogenase
MRIPLLRPCVILACAAALYLSTPSNNAAAESVTEVLVRGLDTPWALDFAPDGRIFISERPGRIRVVEHGQLRPEPWMELEVTATGEAGLLGIAVDPQFSQNRFDYAAYSYRVGAFSLRNRLVRLREDPKAATGVLDKILIDNVAGASNHDGDRVKFGPTENSTRPSVTRRPRVTRRISNP